VGIVTTANSSTVAADEVINQNPTAGTTVPPGSAVDFVVVWSKNSFSLAVSKECEELTPTN